MNRRCVEVHEDPLDANNEELIFLVRLWAGFVSNSGRLWADRIDYI